MKDKTTPVNSDNTSGNNKSKDIGEWTETQKIPRQVQAIQTKQNLSKLRKKIQPKSCCRMHKDKLTSNAQETKQFWSKILEKKEHYRNAERTDHIKKSPEADIHLVSLRTILKKIPNGKTFGQNDQMILVLKIQVYPPQITLVNNHNKIFKMVSRHQTSI